MIKLSAAGSALAVHNTHLCCHLRSVDAVCPAARTTTRSYATFAMGVAAEVVALLVAGPSVDKLGRHTVVSLGLLLGGGACLACANIRGDLAQAVMAAIGKFGCSGDQGVRVQALSQIPSSVPVCCVRTGILASPVVVEHACILLSHLQS